MNETKQFFLSLNHWSSLKKLLRQAPENSCVVVKSQEQKCFIRELVPTLKVVTERGLPSAAPLYIFWPFEFQESSEAYFKLAEQGEVLWLVSWSWSKNEINDWKKRMQLSQGPVHLVQTKQWSPSWGDFSLYWMQRRWMHRLSWGERATIIYADDQDLRQLKRFYKREEIVYRKRSHCLLREFQWRVPAFGEHAYFTHKASQSVEFRYFQGFQRRPQRVVYLIEYARLWWEKIIAPLRFI